MPVGGGGGPPPDDDGGGDKSSAILRAPLNLPKIPRKIGRKPPLKGTRRETLQDIARRVPVDVMRPYFNYPLRTAADAMCISVTSLKRLCRRHGVKRWPHRQLSGLNRAVTLLEAKREPSRSDPAVAEQLSQLYRRREQIIDLAFMSDDNSSEPRGDSFSRPYGEDGEKARDSDTGPDPMDSSLTREEAPDRDLAPPPARISRNPEETIPWWHREPDARHWQQRTQHPHQQQSHHRHQHQHQHHHQHQHQHQYDHHQHFQHDDDHQRHSEGQYAVGADSVDGAQAGKWPVGRKDQDGPGSLRRSLVDVGGKEGRGGGKGSDGFRGSSSVEHGRFQDMPPCPPAHPIAMATAAAAHSRTGQQRPSAEASLEIPPRSPLSKQPTVGGRSSKGVGTATHGRAWDREPPAGLTSVPPPPHFGHLSLPPPQRHHHHHHHHRHHLPHHPPRGDDGVEAGIARTAAFGDLFSSGTGSQQRGGQFESRGSGGSAAGGGGGGGGHRRFSGEEGGQGDPGPDDSRPLPSIARLVEASAMLSAAGEGEWRYSQDRPQQQQQQKQQQQASFRRVHEHAGAM